MPPERLNLDRLSESERESLVQQFADLLPSFLRDKQTTKEKFCEKMDIDTRQFDNFLRILYATDRLQVKPLLLYGSAKALEKRYGLQSVTVVAGSSLERFGEAAAREFMAQVKRIGEGKTAGASFLNVGIVSGRTTGAVIRAVTRIKNWAEEQQLDLAKLPPIRVFALNVCLTVREYLSGNSTILAHQLAEKLKAEGARKVEAYGLSAPVAVAVAEERLSEVDHQPQTFDVVRHTEPYRVKDKLERLGVDVTNLKPDTTELDIVITGVGAPPRWTDWGEESVKGQESSIFYSLVKEFDFDMEALRQAEVVGDIAFTAIQADGRPVYLRKKVTNSRGPTGKDSEHMFYTAVRLPVLEGMAKDPNKAVILAAPYSKGRNKVRALLASVGNPHRYASSLVTDERTAAELRQFHDPQPDEP